MSLPSEVDVAIIGAGAAGLGAAHALENSGLSVHRAGSARPRRRTRPHHPGGPRHHLRPRLRLAAFGGRKFLRPDRRTTEFRNRQDPPAVARAGRTTRRFRRRSARTSSPRSTRSTTAPRRPRSGRRTGRDAAANLYLEPGNRWNPMIDAISTYINGAELDRVSILDMDAYEDTEINWRVRRGYGALMAAYGATCPLALNCQVTLIDHSGTTPADRDLARHADGGQGDRHRPDQSDRRSNPFASTPRCRQRSTPRAACRSGSPTR